jgi:transcriptional regulator with XRE-family HTH domain
MKKDEGNICGKRIKLARVAKDMMQIDLASALNVDFNISINQNGVSQIERGVRVVKDYEIIALAEILDIHPMKILYGDDVPEKFGK